MDGKYNDENIGHFTAAMVSAEWIPIRDIFGGVYAWRHAITGRRISNVDALTYWQGAQAAPVPF